MSCAGPGTAPGKRIAIIIWANEEEAGDFFESATCAACSQVPSQGTKARSVPDRSIDVFRLRSRGDVSVVHGWDV